MLTLLVCAALSQDGEVRRLIDLLANDAIDVRQEAANRLAAIGRAAIPALRAAAAGPDAQRSAAARDVLAAIARRLKIEELQPACVRSDLVLKDEAVEAALGKAARSFGLDAPACAESLRKRTISVDLKQASLWETFDALGRAAAGDLRGLDPTQEPGSENRLVLEERQDRPFEARVNLDDARLIVDTDLGRAPPGGPMESMLRFVLALPSGAWVEDARLADVRITLGERSLDFQTEKRQITCVRARGLPTRVELGHLYVPMTFPVTGPVEIRGVLRLEVPEETEILRPTEGDGRTSLSFPFGKVTGEWSPASREFSVTLQGETGPEKLAIQIAARDAAGEWICDLPLRVRPDVIFQIGHSEVLKEPPARFEGWRVTRVKTRSIPFHFPAVRLTPLR